MLNIFRKKLCWKLGRTYFETYFSIAGKNQFTQMIARQYKSTYDSFGDKKKNKCVRCTPPPKNVDRLISEYIDRYTKDIFWLLTYSNR